jgi:hypothetical protein
MGMSFYQRLMRSYEESTAFPEIEVILNGFIQGGWFVYTSGLEYCHSLCFGDKLGTLFRPALGDALPNIHFQFLLVV